MNYANACTRWAWYSLSQERRYRCLLVLVCLALTPPVVLHLLLRVHFPQSKSTFPVGRGHGNSRYIKTFERGNQDFKLESYSTEFFGSSTWYGANEDSFKKCAVKTCTISTDKHAVSAADAVLMNVRDFSSPTELPPSHPPSQVWILHGSEPPYYVFQDLRRYDNMFNWTSWYRADADIYSPYGIYVNQTDKDVNSAPDAFNLHDKLVFWAASNCHDMGRRYRRVAALRKYLPVDTYGRCGDLKCPKGTSRCFNTFKRYKFVLAFENGYCRDYITEKLWNAYSRDQVPIVSGGADYASFAVPGSYIDYDNFTSVKELAEFILRVASDRDLYNSFFEWKTKYRVQLTQAVANWCQICAALHDEKRQPQVYSDIHGWFAEDSCPVYAGIRQQITPYLAFKLFRAVGI